MTDLGIMRRLKENDLPFFAVFVVLSLSVISGFVFSVTVQFVSFAVLLICLSVIFSKKHIKSKSLPAVLLPLAAVFLSYLRADFQVNVRNVSMALINSLLAFLLMIYAGKKSKENIFLTVLFLGLWVSFLLFVQFFTGGCAIEPSVALNINILSGFLILAYPAALGFAEKNKYPVVFIFIAFIIFSAILLTSSRAAAALAYSVSAFYFIKLKERKEFRFFFIAVSLFFAAGISYAFALKAGSNSFSERIIWWKTALLMFKDNPFFGIGFGNYGALFSFYRPAPVLNTLFAHNTFLQIFAETGMAGIICFGAAFYAAAKNIFVSFKNKRGDAVYMRAALIGVAAFLIFNITEYSFYVPACMTAFFVLCGFLCVCETGERKKNIPYALLAAPVFFLIYAAAYPALAWRYYENGKRYAAAKDFENAVKLYLQAVKFDKKNPEYYHQAAESSFRLYVLSAQRELSYLDDTINFELQSEKFYRHSAQIKAGLANLYNLKGDSENARKYALAAGEADRFNPHYGKLK